MAKDRTLRVIIIEDSQNTAEHLISHLRNAGHAVRQHLLSDEASLIATLEEQPIDLIMVGLDTDEPTLDQVIQQLKRLKLKLPILAIADEYDIKLTTDTMRRGATDLVARNLPDHMQLVIRREMDHLKQHRKLAEARRIASESSKRCNALLDTSADAITYVHDGMHVYANPVYLKMFGFDNLEDIEGTPIMDMAALADHEKLKEFLRSQQADETNMADTLDITGLKTGGEEFSASMEFTPASFENEPCTQIVIRARIGDSEELEKKLKSLTRKDMLTGLDNRQHFMDMLNKDLAHYQTHDRTGAVLFVTPDKFKSMQENIGLSGTDQVIQKIATIMKDSLPDALRVARFSDFCYTVFLAGEDNNGILQAAETFRKNTADHIYQIADKSITATCSIGVSIIGPLDKSGQDVVSYADLACEMAIKEGGNRVHLHNPIADRDAKHQREERWLNLVQQALKKNLFQLVYQPVASLHGEPGEQYEVLIRIKGPDSEGVTPSQFLSIASKHDLMTHVDRWVVTHAIKALASHRKRAHDTLFFIKISTDSLIEAEFTTWLQQQIKKSKLPGDRMVFELSASSINLHMKTAAEFGAMLSSLGCQLAIEHFTADHDSYLMLKYIKPNFIKIEGQLIRELSAADENQEAIRKLADKAQSMGIATIAHFVEDASSLAVLWQCGINYIQGNFLQAPSDKMTYDFEGEADDESEG
ncbi:MAG TPA: EAL domain-containing protein [Gammaproteobacteria bacterium]|nr:EAL domain-containing protein [Gammaproteobacteria bacterium]